jgi:hypothetical protein
MIVKNEAHIIASTLENICNYIPLDYWVIVDTGSTDDTKQIIRDFFESKNIKGELHETEWKNFGFNRSDALSKAFNKTDYLFVDNALNNTSISNYINNKVFLNLITIPTAFDIQFLQIVKNNMNLITTPITNIISSYTNKYIVPNSYRTIISTQTFNYFSNGSKPILIVFIRDYFIDEINKNNSVQLTPTSNLFIILKNYYIEIKNKLKFIQIDNNTTLFTLESFIQKNLISMPITSLNYLKIYLKYTLYELTFIRLLTTNINSIKSSYIISFLNEANIIYKKNVEFIEIIGNIEINDFYNTLVRNFPAILFFKRSFYTIDRYRVPCKILSGENYYTNKSIPRIKLFIKTSLNY